MNDRKGKVFDSQFLRLDPRLEEWRRECCCGSSNMCLAGRKQIQAGKFASLVKKQHRLIRSGLVLDGDWKDIKYSLLSEAVSARP